MLESEMKIELETEVKVIAMYLPQYHSIPENDEFWGKGFTDWVSVKAATPVYEGHKQPRIPLNNNYYDLSIKQNVLWQANLAKKYGVYGFGIYHYWFSREKCLLTKPAEILLNSEEINMPFFFAWDNISWKRSWSKIKGNDWSPIADDKNDRNSQPLLIEYQLGGEEEWKKHFDYLLPYFKDRRYIKKDNKPVFVIYHCSEKIREMGCYWDKLAKDAGFDGVCMIYRYDTIHKIPKSERRFYYEPIHSAWGGVCERIANKLNIILGKKSVLKIYDYDKVWRNLLNRAVHTKDDNLMYGAFVSYDDTPRRGASGKVVKGATPQKFCNYMKRLIEICNKQKKEFIFLTAWNEWGEGAYLEPDEENTYSYLEALQQAKSLIES